MTGADADTQDPTRAPTQSFPMLVRPPTPMPPPTKTPLPVRNTQRQFLDRPRTKPRAIRPAVLNLYEPDPAPATLNASKPMHLYDINCAMPFHLLETDHVRLEPLVPSKHLDAFLALPKESWDTLGMLGPYDRKSALEDLEDFRSDERCLLLAVIDKQAESAGRPGFAGVYGLVDYDEESMTVVFGVINISPKYHRTHVNTHAMSLVLHWLFDELHLVRVQYDAVTFNAGSIRAAERLGFREEGVMRNLHGVVPAAKKRKGEEGRQSQDLWVSSMTDWEWEVEGRRRLEEMVSRRVVDTHGF